MIGPAAMKGPTPGGGAFRGLGVLLVGEGAGAFVVREQDGDVGVGEAGGEEVVDRSLGEGWGLVDAEDSYVLAGHDDLSW
jgi:hypothetical protein